MKRVINTSISPYEVIAESVDGMFTLVRRNDIGINDTPWEGMEVLNNGLAKKHVVDVVLRSKNSPDFDGQPVRYEYEDAYVSHGMRGAIDTLEETNEYIEVLESALNFAEETNEYITQWNNNAL